MKKSAFTILTHSLAHIQLFILQRENQLHAHSPATKSSAASHLKEGHVRLCCTECCSALCTALNSTRAQYQNKTSAMDQVCVFTAPQANHGHLVLSSLLFPVTVSVLIFASSFTNFTGYRREALPAAVKQQNWGVCRY